MKKIFVFSILFALFPVSVAYADVHVESTGDSNVSVQSNTNGESTTCINGNCTTTGGGGKSTVCINGKCQESDGDMDIEEGSTKVNIKTSNSKTTTTSANSTNNSVNIKVNTSTNSADKSSTKSAEEIKKKMQEKKEKVKSFFDRIEEFFHNLFN